MAMISPLLPAPICTCFREDRSTISGVTLGHGDCYRRSSGGLHFQDVYMRRRTSSGWYGGIGVWWPIWSERRRGQHRRGSRNSRFRRQHGWEPNNRPERLRESGWCLSVILAGLLCGRMEPQHRGVFLRIKHDGLLFSAQLFALRNRRWDVHSAAAGLVPWRNNRRHEPV